jgi:hypothetical protein
MSLPVALHTNVLVRLLLNFKGIIPGELQPLRL